MNFKYNAIPYLFLIYSLFLSSCKSTQDGINSTNSISDRWTTEKAIQWYSNIKWPIGANFNPSTAINQLEFWQEETFDTATIDLELGWATQIGFNTMRVYLHHVAWEQDQVGFKRRMEKYLSIATNHGIKTIFVFMDDCWNPRYAAGKQPDPKPGVHNSGWVRDPGDLYFEDDSLNLVLEKYVTDVISHFKSDERILMWDLYNEPGNSGYGNQSMPLLQDVFTWARKVNPSQPLTSGVWNNKLSDLNAFQLANSDIITYHNYEALVAHIHAIDTLTPLGRPLICTEYMARRNNSYFTTILPMLYDRKVGAINWGLVDGKSNTKYAWDEPIADGSEPPLWFHEVFRKDGSPYDTSEVNIIKKYAIEKAKEADLHSNK